jgi:hypothetical protein
MDEEWWQEIRNYKSMGRRGRRVKHWREDFETDKSKEPATKRNS